MNLWPSSTTYWHESVLMRGESGVPGENPRSQVEIYWNSAHLQKLVEEVRGVNDDHYVSLTPRIPAREISQTVIYPIINYIYCLNLTEYDTSLGIRVSLFLTKGQSVLTTSFSCPRFWGSMQHKSFEGFPRYTYCLVLRKLLVTAV